MANAHAITSGELLTRRSNSLHWLGPRREFVVLRSEFDTTEMPDEEAFVSGADLLIAALSTTGFRATTC